MSIIDRFKSALHRLKGREFTVYNSEYQRPHELLELRVAKQMIQANETRGRANPYTVRSDKPTKRDGGRLDWAWGKYQVMGDNIPSWTKEALGKAYSVQQFVNDPDAQEKVADHFMLKAKRKFGTWNDAASVWFTGRPLAQGANAQDAFGTTGSEYVSKFAAGMAAAGYNAGFGPTGHRTTAIAQTLGSKLKDKLAAVNEFGKKMTTIQSPQARPLLSADRLREIQKQDEPVTAQSPFQTLFRKSEKGGIITGKYVFEGRVGRLQEKIQELLAYKRTPDGKIDPSDPNFALDVGTSVSPLVGLTGRGLREGLPALVRYIANTDDFEKIASRVLKEYPDLGDDVARVVGRHLEDETDPVVISRFLTKTAGGETAERGFIKTVREAPATTDIVAEGIQGAYGKVSNTTQIRQARQLVGRDIDAAERLFNTTDDAFSRHVGQQLLLKHQAEGQLERAIAVAEKLAEKATNQGQAIQALAAFQKLTPEGILRYAESVIGKANKEIAKAGGKPIKLTESEAKSLLEQATKIQKMPEGRKKDIATARMLVDVAEKVPSTIGTKVAFVQTLAQLLNAKTLIRNFVGNAGLVPAEMVKDVAAWALDTPLALITGKRSKGFPAIRAQFRGFGTGLKEGIEEALAGVDLRMGGTKFDLPKTPVFKSKVGRAAQKTLNVMLRAVDRAFYQAARDGSLYEQMRLAGVSKPTDEMLEIAHLDGLYRTFQDDTALSQAMTRIKSGLNLGKNFGLGDLTVKYPKTPANLLSRGIEYSPAGLLKFVYEVARPAFRKEFRQRDAVEAFGRAMVGTTLMGTGAVMHQLGLLTGRRNDDPDVSATERTIGLDDYQINLSAFKRFAFSGMDPEMAKYQEGDELITYDWFQPLAITIAVGADIDGTFGKEGDNDVVSVASTILDALARGVDTLGEQPLLQGLRRAATQRNMSEGALTILEGSLSSFTPTTLSQVNQMLNNSVRETYDPSTINYAWNLAKNRIPGLSGTLPVKNDVWGEQMERYQDGSNNLFNVFFNPAFQASYQPTPEADMVLQLMNETGETSQFPRVIGKTAEIKKTPDSETESIELTPTQRVAMQQYVGRITRTLFASIAADPRFQQLPPEERVKYLSNILSDVGLAGRIVILGHRPPKPSKRAIQIIQMFR